MSRRVRDVSLGGGIGGILYCKDGQSNFYYYHYDGSGNVTSITDDDGDEVAIYEYDAFGNVLTEAGSLSNEFKFSTKQADKRGQLIDFGFRWYDPEVGRWTQRDPFGLAAGLNLYTYCNSNPPNLVDPWGLQWWQQGGGRRDEQNCGRRGRALAQTPVPGGWYVEFEDGSAKYFKGDKPPFDVPIVAPPEPEPTVFEDASEILNDFVSAIEHATEEYGAALLKGIGHGLEAAGHGISGAATSILGALLSCGSEAEMVALIVAAKLGAEAGLAVSGHPIGAAVGAVVGVLGVCRRITSNNCEY